MSSLTWVLLVCSPFDYGAVGRINEVAKDDYGHFERYGPPIVGTSMPIGVFMLEGNYLALSDLLVLIAKAAWRRPRQLQVFSRTEHEDRFTECVLDHPVEIGGHMAFDIDNRKWTFEEQIKCT